MSGRVRYFDKLSSTQHKPFFPDAAARARRRVVFFNTADEVIHDGQDQHFRARGEGRVMDGDETLPELHRGHDGRFLPGNGYGAGKGSRERLSKAFLADLLDHWETHGRDAIERVCGEKPDRYLQIVAQFVPREVKVEVSELEAMSDEELRQALAATLTDLAENGGELIASLPPRTCAVLDLHPTGKRLS